MDLEAVLNLARSTGKMAIGASKDRIPVLRWEMEGQNFREGAEADGAITFKAGGRDPPSTTGNSKVAERRIFAEGRISGCRQSALSPRVAVDEAKLSAKCEFAERRPLGIEKLSAKISSPTVQPSAKRASR